MKIKLFINLPNPELLYPNDENGRQINLYQVSSGYLTGHSLFYPNVLIKPVLSDTLTLPYHEMTMSLKRGTRYEDEGMEFELSDVMSEFAIEERPVFFFIYNTDNYFHFLYDTLPYLISFNHLRKLHPNLKLLMNYSGETQTKFYKFVIEFLELFEIGHDDILMARSDCVYQTIYISSSYTHNGLSNSPPRHEVHRMYLNLVRKAEKLEANNFLRSVNYDRIYISRRTWIHNDLSNIGTNYTTRRKMVNEDALVELLTKKYGFVEVFTENMDTVSKILMFYRAKFIIGAIGGGISNALFSTNWTKLLAIVSPCFMEINQRFHFSLDVADVDYFEETQLDQVIGGFSKYIRVKHIETGQIGEIVEIVDRSNGGSNDGSNDHELILKVALSHATGWNSESNYEIVEFKSNQVIKLDNGLNSPYSVDLSKIDELLDPLIDYEPDFI